VSHNDTTADGVQYPKHVAFRCDDETISRADAIADELGTSRSAMFRVLISEKYREISDTDADP
jgi:predicted transcriptional regulator